MPSNGLSATIAIMSSGSADELSDIDVAGRGCPTWRCAPLSLPGLLRVYS
jgi:hypothetical protein